MASVPLHHGEPDPLKQLISARKLQYSRSVRGSLVSGIQELDSLFSQVGEGDLIEWGIPPGLNGRLIPLQFLKQNIPASVWIYHHHNLAVFASSWISHGVDLERLYFIRSANPVAELKPIFLEDTFKRIFIDSPKKLSAGDLAFIAAQARLNRQVIFLIRHFFLSRRNGNPHAGVRLNSWQDEQGRFSIQVLKGADIGTMRIPAAELYHDAI